VQLGGGTNSAYVEGLRKNSKEFSNISEQWIERGQRLQIRTFYEADRMHGILVVDKDSARLNLPNEVAVGIAGADHRTVCKFEDIKSQKYRPVWNAMKAMAGDIRVQQSKADECRDTDLIMLRHADS
jgi:hypothetical protein